MRKQLMLLGLSLVGVAALAAAVYAAASVKIVLENEHYSSIKASMRVTAGKTCSGKKYIEIPLRRPHGENESGPADDGNATYNINIPSAGNYTLWARAYWYDTCGDSFFVIVDDTNKSWIGEDGTCGRWHWVKGKTYTLSAGAHTLSFQNREDGAALDQFMLTTNPPSRYVPTRIEHETPNYLIK